MSQGLPRTNNEVIEQTIRTYLSNMHSAKPGRVVTFYPATTTSGPTADVELGVKHAVFDKDGNRTYEDYPVLQQVPVGRLRSGGFLISLPVSAGDAVQVFFNDTSTDEWRQTGQVVEPGDPRRHSIGHPICVPILTPDVQGYDAQEVASTPNALVIGIEGSHEQIVIQSGSIAFGTSPSSFVALANKVDAALAAMVATFNGHTHAVPALGTSAVPAPLATGPASTASTLVTSE